MAPKKVALFIDADDLHQRLRSLHNRSLDPALLVELAAARGEVVRAEAIADWRELPESVSRRFEALDAVERVQVDRTSRRDGGSRRREVVHDVVDLEVLARMVEALFADGGPEIDLFVLGTTSQPTGRAVGLVRDRFQKDVVVVGIEGARDGLGELASEWVPLPMPAVPPEDPEALEALVPLLEDLERRKRYLNFKYIRETVVRRLDAAGRSFERAEEILSDAIACGVLLKIKVDDKYNPGQHFTAYALDRDSEHFARWGSGEPAPEHDDEPPPPAKGKGKPDKKKDRKRAEDDEGKKAGDDDGGRRKERRGRQGADADDRDEGGGRRRRRRRRRGSGADAPSADVQLSAGGSQKNDKKKRGRGRNHQQDRVGRVYEAPSRFLAEEEERPVVRDDEIDEDQILRARGDLG